MKKLLLLILATTAFACGGDSDGGPGGSADRGGPDSLEGYEWKADPVTINGLRFDFALSFSSNSVSIKNTCDQSLSVTATAPARYRYSASVPSASEAGDESCFVQVHSGEFDFELVDGTMVVSQGQETMTFAPAGASNAGLYGEWKASGDGFDLIWSLGNGQIVATAECPNGQSATTSASADFTNWLEITAAAEETTTEGALECTATISAGTYEYYFDGSTLVWVDQNGQELRLD